MGLLTLLDSHAHRIAVAWKPIKRFALAIEQLWTRAVER